MRGTNKDPERAERIRLTVVKLLDQGFLQEGKVDGAQSLMARHFGVSRQLVSQVVHRERERRRT